MGFNNIHRISSKNLLHYYVYKSEEQGVCQCNFCPAFSHKSQSSCRPVILYHSFVVFFVGSVDISDPSDLMTYIMETRVDGKKMYCCTICNKLISNSTTNAKNHIESVHFPGMFSYSCDECGRQCTSKNSLSIHMTRYHKK